jgi:glutamyl-tRNA synthetase
MKYTRGDTVVGFEKLWFLQKRHAARYASAQASSPRDQKPSHSLLELAVKPILALLERQPTSADNSFYRNITQPTVREYLVQRYVFADAQNYTNPTDFIQRNYYFFTPPSVEVLTATVPALTLHKIPVMFPITVSSATITSLCQVFMDIPEYLWGVDTIKSYLLGIINRSMKLTMEKSSEDLPTGQALNTMLSSLEKGWVKLIHQYLRWALMAGKPGLDSLLTMELLGMKETGRRLATAAEVLNALKSDNADSERGKI